MNRPTYRVEYQENPSRDEKNIIFEGIAQEASLKKKMSPIRHFTLLLKDSEERVCGGLYAALLYGCLYVDMLWVKTEWRSKGFGRTLMTEAEKIAQTHLCTFATVQTMDWEALPFYQKLGYTIEFVREGYENASRMYLLRKSIKLRETTSTY